MLSAKKELFTPSGGGYQISRSVRLRSSASAYLSRTLGTATNNKIWTWSGWIKRGKPGGSSASGMHLFGTGSASTDAASTQIQFDGENLLLTGYATNWLKSNAIYRDPSAWYHIVVAWDNSNATVANRAKMYVNGVEISYSIDNRASLSTSSTYGINQAVLHTIGAWSWNNGTFAQPEYYDGYLTEINFIDGQALTPSSFGETNALTGVWQPKRYTGTYGTNGFYLNFSDNSGATATTIGKDYSGNGNNWTPNNISITAGATYDSMIDVPTLYADGGNGRGNYAVLNPLGLPPSGYSAGTFASGNLQFTTGGVKMAKTTMPFPTSGKWYVECRSSGTSASIDWIYGLTGMDAATPVNHSNPGVNLYISDTAYWLANASTLFTQAGAISSSDVFQIAYDADTGKVYLGKNNTYYNSAGSGTGNPSAGTNQFATLSTSTSFCAYTGGNSSTTTSSINFGQQPFTYTPPTGFKALNTQNLPDATIKRGNDYFDIVTRTGTGASAAISSYRFAPDFVWIKARTNAYYHKLLDKVRGANKVLASNATDAEITETQGLMSFDASGYTLGTSSDSTVNNSGSGQTYVDWAWNAGGSTVTNTSGSITSQVRANPTAGFSVVTYTGTGANATVGHGLGVAPRMIIIKARNLVSDWVVYHTSVGNTGALLLDLTSATSVSINYWNNTSPTSSVFSLGIAGGVNNSSSNTYVAYCFAAVAGYSAFGSYTGNGSTDGPFVYTGFRPRWIMVKRFDSTGYWIVEDSSRNTYNAVQNELFANASDAEYVGGRNVDFLSNGFKLRHTDITQNASGGTYIYAAFAENPFKNSLAR